jgi:hypothetical protein
MVTSNESLTARSPMTYDVLFKFVVDCSLLLQTVFTILKLHEVRLVAYGLLCLALLTVVTIPGICTQNEFFSATLLKAAACNSVGEYKFVHVM